MISAAGKRGHSQGRLCFFLIPETEPLLSLSCVWCSSSFKCIREWTAIPETNHKQEWRCFWGKKKQSLASNLWQIWYTRLSEYRDNIHFLTDGIKVFWLEQSPIRLNQWQVYGVRNWISRLGGKPRIFRAAHRIRIRSSPCKESTGPGERRCWRALCVRDIKFRKYISILSSL